MEFMNFNDFIEDIIDFSSYFENYISERDIIINEHKNIEHQINTNTLIENENYNSIKTNNIPIIFKYYELKLKIIRIYPLKHYNFYSSFLLYFL